MSSPFLRSATTLSCLCLAGSLTPASAEAAVTSDPCYSPPVISNVRLTSTGGSMLPLFGEAPVLTLTAMINRACYVNVSASFTNVDDPDETLAFSSLYFTTISGDDENRDGNTVQVQSSLRWPEDTEGGTYSLTEVRARNLYEQVGSTYSDGTEITVLEETDLTLGAAPHAIVAGQSATLSGAVDGWSDRSEETLSVEARTVGGSWGSAGDVQTDYAEEFEGTVSPTVTTFYRTRSHLPGIEAVSRAVRVLVARKVSLNVSRSTVPAGGSVSFKGGIFPTARTKVSLQRRLPGGRWSTLAMAPTSGGRYVFESLVTRGASYRVVAAPTPRNARGTSRAVAVRVPAVRRPAAPRPSNPSVYYENCTAARNAGAAPVYRGEPGYGPHLDRDGDGVGCE